jgi:hypothetical protein
VREARTRSTSAQIVAASLKTGMTTESFMAPLE